MRACALCRGLISALRYGGFVEEFGKEFEDVSRNLRSVDVGRNPKGNSSFLYFILLWLQKLLKNNYKEAEPIFFSDIVIEEITKSAVNQQLKKLCDEGKLQKYENGIYYLPKKSRLKTNIGVNADMVARYKYVSRGGKVDGLLSCFLL